MAESMQGLHRSHRCTEVSNANIGEKACVDAEFIFDGILELFHGS